MPRPCPHCGGRYLPFGAVLQHSVRLGGAALPLRCARCGQPSYVSLTGRNAQLALIVLILGAVASIPSPVSNAILAGVPQPWLAVVRAQIWSAAILISLVVFVFAQPLVKGASDITTIGRFSLAGYIIRFGFWALLGLWGYVMYRALANAA